MIYTNLAGRRLGRAKGFNGKATNREEIDAFIGLHLLADNFHCCATNFLYARNIFQNFQKPVTFLSPFLQIPFPFMNLGKEDGKSEVV